MCAMSGSSTIYVALVDDDESVCRSFGRLLRAAGMQLITYPSAEAYLDDRKRPRFDCLVLDVRLGGMSGIELGQRLEDEGGHPPFIIVTAHDSAETRAEARAAGCSAYLLKSDPGQAVLAVIRSLVV